MQTSTATTMQAELPQEYNLMVLLVDDQLMVGESIRRMLGSEGNIDFHFCPSAQDALATAHEIRPTVILQDLVMPGINGMDLVRQYRSDPVTSSIPVIVLSATEDAAVKRAAFQAGATDYLVKLPDKVELLARIQHHSRAYLNQLQRDEAYRALRESQRQLMEANFELQRLTHLDGLTGLSNRRYFDQQIEAEWARALQDKTTVSLLMIDVDHFKLINDTGGHLMGDTILKYVGELILQTFPLAQCTARYGGDEFAILQRGITTEELRSLAEILRAGIEDLQQKLPGTNGAGAYMTISIGGTTLAPRAGETFHRLIDIADRALYEAKNAGRNQVVIQ